MSGFFACILLSHFKGIISIKATALTKEQTAFHIHFYSNSTKTNNPSKQSTIGDKYTFPAEIANSVILGNHLLLDFFAKNLFLFHLEQMLLFCLHMNDISPFFLLLPPDFLYTLSHRQSSRKQ